jgi:hypothetical protein
MSYEFELHELEGPFTDAEGSRIVEFILGFDAEADAVVVMSVMLVPTDRTDTLELCFGIRTKNEEGNVSPPNYSKEGRDKYVPKASRATVLASVKAAITAVVSDAAPDYIVMETFYGNLPTEALKKYDVIGASVIVCGYLVADSFRADDTGINYWIFKRRD